MVCTVLVHNACVLLCVSNECLLNQTLQEVWFVFCNHFCNVSYQQYDGVLRVCFSSERPGLFTDKSVELSNRVLQANNCGGVMATKLYRQLLDNLTTAVMLIDDRLALVYMNPAAEMLLEASERRLFHVPVRQWLMLAEDDWQLLQEALRNQSPFTKREAKVKSLAGQEFTVDYSVNPMQQHGEKLLLLELHPRDRWLRISREEELLSQHETSINLVRGLAHEIKNPLGGLRGAAQLLQRELAEPELHDYTRVIINEADRLRDLVDRLLGPYRRPQLAAVNIHAVLEHVASLLEAETAGQIQLQRDYDPSLPEFAGDQSQLIQAVLNIVRNSMQALQEASTEQPCITLCTRVVRNITLGSETHRLLCSVEVIDNGPGVPADLLSKIFYPMVSGRAAGTGLGLAIAQTILSQHGGLIECKTQPGETCFQLLIPLQTLPDGLPAATLNQQENAGD